MLALALVAYLPAALRAQFLGFDDNFFFGPDNPEFREGLGAVLDPGRPIANAYLPVAHASLWFDAWLGGFRPLLPHLTALVLHALAGAVFVRWLLQLRMPSLAAHVAGALFVVHPALAESVAWVSGRKDVLSGLFVFAALLQTAKAGPAPGWPRFVAIGLFGALAMYSKATAVVQPLLALLVCWLVPGSPRRFLAPLVLLVVTVPIAWHHQTLAAAEGTLAAGSVADRLVQVPGAFQHYTATALWPLGLNVLYPERQTLERFAAAWGPALATVGAAVAAAAAAWWWPRMRLAAFGLSAFFVGLLPFNTAFPASSIAAADRYLYLAIPGLALGLVALLQQVGGRPGVVAAAALGLPMVWLCGSRAHDFGDTATLWRSSLAVDADNAVAHINLSIELLAKPPTEVAVVRGHLEAAVRAARYPIHELRARRLLVQLGLQVADYELAALHARGAIAAAEALLASETSPANRARAEAFVLQARLAAFEPLRLAADPGGAERILASVEAAFPDHPDVVAFRALRALEPVTAELVARAAAGLAPVLAEDDPRAVLADRQLADALVQHPDHAQLLVAQASWLRVRGLVLPALRSYLKAQAADPQCVEAWLGAARMLRERENYVDAIRHAQGGLRHRPDPALLQEQALALVGLGRLDDAIVNLEAYLRLRPHDQDAAKVLSNVLSVQAYARLSEGGAPHAEVKKIVERALAYNPKEPRAHLVLGRIAGEQRRYGDAVEHLRRAHRMMPDFEDARQLLAENLSQLGWQRHFGKDDEGAAEAWLECVGVAPPGFDLTGVHQQLQRIWRLHEERGLSRRKAGDRTGAIADFRRCLQLDPTQHWGAWLLASTLHDQPDADLAEVEALCRQALAGQRQHQLDQSQQVLLLAATLARRGDKAAARALVEAYLKAPDADAKPQVIKALQEMVGQ
jgi:tetratricopeptide (TPR) repeat protein